MLSVSCGESELLTNEWVCDQRVTSSSSSLRKRVEAVLDMALTTVSSLNESFTSGTPLVSEDQPAVSVEKDKEGSSIPIGPEDNVPAEGQKVPKDGDQDAEVKETPAKEKEGSGEVQEVSQGGSEKPVEVGGDGEGEESESGSEDDAILQVHV